MEQIGLAADNPDLAFSDFDSLGERAQVIAAVSSAFGSHPLACSCGETGQHVWGNGFSAGVFERGGGALGIHPCAIARRLEGGDALLKVGVAQVRESPLDGIKQALQTLVCLGGALVQFGNVRALACRMLLPAVQNHRQNAFQPFGLEQAFLQMAGDEIVELFHRHGHTAATGWPLSCLGRAGVVPIAPALAGADGHGAAAFGAMDQAGKEGGAADHLWWCGLGVSGLHPGLHRIEGFLIDDRGYIDDHELRNGIALAPLAVAIEFVAPGVCPAGQYHMDRAAAPAAAVTGGDGVGIQPGCDRLDTHRPVFAIAL